MAGPPRAVLEAFGLERPATRLPGGQGTTWRVGDAVLKPLDVPPEQLAWQAGLLAGLSGRDDLRVSVPLATGSGAWSCAGWTASRFEPGRHLPGRWLEVARAGERFHAAVAQVPAPAFLAERTDPWSVGDRVAWGELAWDPSSGCVGRLLAGLRPVQAPSQLVHGDLTGNVLFCPGLPPLVIDLSPYWRPPVWASAVVVADALVFSGASETAVEPLLARPGFPQHLLRALVYRAVTAEVARPDRRHEVDEVYDRAVGLALRRAAAAP